MTGLATGSAPVGLHTMLGLVDGEYRRTPTLVVAEGTLLVAFQGSVDLCQRGQRAEKYRNAGTDQKKPNQFAHLFPSHRESGSLLLTFRTVHVGNPRRAELREGQATRVRRTPHRELRRTSRNDSASSSLGLIAC